METATLGKVLVAATVENLGDILNVQSGKLNPEEIRRVHLDEAMVDTGAKLLSLPTRLIRQLGLKRLDTRQGMVATGVTDVDVYSAVWLTIGGRRCTVDAAEWPMNAPHCSGMFPSNCST